MKVENTQALETCLNGNNSTGGYENPKKMKQNLILAPSFHHELLLQALASRMKLSTNPKWVITNLWFKMEKNTKERRRTISKRTLTKRRALSSSL